VTGFLEGYPTVTKQDVFQTMLKDIFKNAMNQLHETL